MTDRFNIELLTVVIAMSVSMALIPLLIKYAPMLGMMDKPDERKVHVLPIPRVGGVGIVVGALLPLLVWLPLSPVTISYFLGGVVLLVFGVWDDVRELGHYVKFIGQFIAVILVVYYGDLFVSHLPLIGLDPLGETAGKVFTVIAMVGVINAINHSDGLDGLAGGESLLSLGAIAYLATQSSDFIAPMIALATMGGVFGFLRFNSHPARVFMGDGGSQFIGFTLAFLAVYITNVSNTALSPALPALLLGLPVIDIIAVFIQRIYGGMNWFRATKNHIHHRLLELGLYHYESVILIYSVQAMLVIAGVLMPYESDALILGYYVFVCAALFTTLIYVERKGWKAHRSAGKVLVDDALGQYTRSVKLVEVNHKLISGFLSLFLLTGAIFAKSVPKDVAIVAGLLFVLLSLRLVFGYRFWFLFLRLIVFVALAFVAYLFEYFPHAYLERNETWSLVFYGILAFWVVVAIRFSSDGFFQATPLDYLAVLLVFVITILSESGYIDASAGAIAAQLIILFFGAEVVIKHMKKRVNAFTLSSLVSLAIVATRGVF